MYEDLRQDWIQNVWGMKTGPSEPSLLVLDAFRCHVQHRKDIRHQYQQANENQPKDKLTGQLGRKSCLGA